MSLYDISFSLRIRFNLGHKYKKCASSQRRGSKVMAIWRFERLKLLNRQKRVKRWKREKRFNRSDRKTKIWTKLVLYPYRSLKKKKILKLPFGYCHCLFIFHFFLSLVVWQLINQVEFSIYIRNKKRTNFINRYSRAIDSSYFFLPLMQSSLNRIIPFSVWLSIVSIN